MEAAGRESERPTQPHPETTTEKKVRDTKIKMLTTSSSLGHSAITNIGRYSYGGSRAGK